LREVLARADNDFLFSEPKRKSRRSNRQRSLFMRVFLLVRGVAAHPNRIAATLLAGLVVAICVNALELQHTRHPAPLFHQSFKPPVSPSAAPAKERQAAAFTPTPAAPAPVVPAPAAPVPMPPLARPDPIGQLLQSATSGRAAAKASAKTEPSRDPISQLLKTDAAQINPQPNKSVLAAQRALVQLGYVLKPDGIDGAATRQAVEQFEHDHGLAGRDGELSPKVLHELSVRSGVSID
jgi:hypothetical protein